MFITIRKKEGRTVKQTLIDKKPTELSIPEKDILSKMLHESEPLPYELVEMETSIGTKENLYSIPQDEKEELLKDLWPFTATPKMSERMFDIHEGKTFIFKDVQIMRWKNWNIIVSPYYLQSGGTLIDFVNPSLADKDTAAEFIIK